MEVNAAQAAQTRRSVEALRRPPREHHDGQTDVYQGAARDLGLADRNRLKVQWRRPPKCGDRAVLIDVVRHGVLIRYDNAQTVTNPLCLSKD